MGRRLGKMPVRRTAIILITIMLVGGVALSACAPGGCASTALPPAKPADTNTPAAPAATPPAAPPAPTPTPPVSAPSVTEKPTSFEATTYNNDQYGFSVKYPKSWAKDNLIGDMVLRVAAQAGDLQSDAIAAAVVDKPSDYGKAAREAVDATLAASGVPVKTKLESIKTTTLSDGVTPAKEAVLSADVYGMYQLYVYALGTDKGEKTISAIGLTIKGDSSKALVKEIVQTLAVK
jgi:hypothetical protein